MAQILLQDWLASESPHVDRALGNALDTLPAACSPVARHILGAGGKRMRPLLTVLCGRLLGYEKDDLYLAAASMEMLHAATLLHDDVLDKAVVRRGQPAAHQIFGMTQTILAGDAMLASGNAIVASFGRPALTLCYSRATSQTAAGEILEMNSLGCPDLSFEKYLEIARGKTACLISQACAMGALLANGSPEQVQDCAAYGEDLGTAFQIVDDALDFAPQSQTGKPCGGDLRERKMTPPLMLYRKSLSPPDREKFDRTFASGIFSESEFNEIVDNMGEFRAETLALAEIRINKAREVLKKLPQGMENSILRQMAEYVRSRSK